MAKTSISVFETYCKERGLRITEPRLLAHDIVNRADKPMSAYDILNHMGKTLSNPKPPTAYRALEFLEEHGFVHRIESLNAYVSCDVNHKHSGSQFMICDSCQAVEEVHLCSLPKKLDEKVQSEAFTLHHWNVELHGICQACTSM